MTTNAHYRSLQWLPLQAAGRVIAVPSVLAIALLSGCATLDTPVSKAAEPKPELADSVDKAVATAKPPAAAAYKPADPTAPKPFADIIKDAKVQDGLFPIWRKDEKVWMEIPKAAFNKPIRLANARCMPAR